ncbi:acyltransferase [bacterium]|nr:acyltransferase [candidate division CSSED10-310 bacterium]
MDEIRSEAKTELQSALTSEKKSALSKYMDIVIGDSSLWHLFKYELIVDLFGWLPGAPGYLLRKVFYPKLFKRCGRNVVFGRNVTIRHPRKITIGDNTVIDDYVVLDAKGDNNRGIELGDNVIIARNTVLSCKGGDISIGDNTNISLNCMIHSESSVRLGSNILIAAYCYIIGGGEHSFERTDIPIIQQGSESKGIVLEDNLWLGAGVYVLDGSYIERDTVVAACAVVNRRLPAYSITAGIPARVAKKRIAPDSAGSVGNQS